MITTPREHFLSALHRCPPRPGSRVPHFELVFYLTMEAFGKVHPCHRSYHQWDQMEERERQLHRRDMAQIFVDTAHRFEHSAIFIHPNPHVWVPAGDKLDRRMLLNELIRLIDLVREISGDRYCLVTHGDATFSIPDGTAMVDFSYRLADEPEKVHAEAAAAVDSALANAQVIAQHGGLDGYALCADYCFNTGPFLSPPQFSEFITPYLARLIAGYRALGFITIKHTDGNIMPVIDQLVQCRPDALHSLDPQGGVDLAEVAQRCGREVCLIGNVNCGLLDTGSDEEVAASVRYALKHGMAAASGGGGYIFSTSNCIYTGMRLARYEMMLDLWRREGIYPAPA